MIRTLFDEVISSGDLHEFFVQVDRRAENVLIRLRAVDRTREPYEVILEVGDKLLTTLTRVSQSNYRYSVAVDRPEVTSAKTKRRVRNRARERTDDPDYPVDIPQDARDAEPIRWWEKP